MARQPSDRAAGRAAWRNRIYRIIFEADTPASRLFDVLLIIAILLSVLVVMLESVDSVRAEHGPLMRQLEWGFTIIFTLEYVLRLVSAYSASRYAKSFFGIVDFLAILPTYLAVVVPGAQFFLVVRMLRVLRVFRVLKLAQYTDQANILVLALRASRRKIEVFLMGVLTLVVILGSMMYFIEGEQHGFTSIPTSIYWAVVTLTTVGYGDISPQTPLGQAFSAIIMIIGYGIIAVPTGIVTSELSRLDRETARKVAEDERVCSSCGKAGHLPDAEYCRHCGSRL